MKRLPAGESSFLKIREGDQLYVDKTKQLYELLNFGDYHFLSRPRRFGKSLTVSALRALFEGKKDLFEGLWICDKWDWEKKHPVLSLSFNGLDYKNQPLELALAKELDIQARALGQDLNGSTSKEKFKELILHLGQSAPVAVLIDEYDKPINDFLHDYQQSDANRDILGNFFGVLKDNDVVDHLRFVFITSVSKFSKVTLFSELNNLTDLTHHPKFGTLVGITQEELERDFAEHIEHLAAEMDISRDELLAKIKHWYNGYTWDGRNFVYNPFSLLHLFGNGRFRNYWFTSGSTSWLVRKFREVRVDIASFEDFVVGELFFDKFEVKNLDPAVLLYQTGYLTIKDIRGGEIPRYRIMEFKVGKTAQAMQQIKDQGYHEKYLNKGKEITLLGVGFDPELRNIGDWKEERA